MVTLPDGTKVKARRVGEGQGDNDEPAPEDWGFAGLARQQAAEAAEAQTDRMSVDVSQDASAPRAALAEASPSSSDPIEQQAGHPELSPDPTLPTQGHELQGSHPPAVLSESADVTDKMGSMKLSTLRAQEVQRRHEQEM